MCRIGMLVLVTVTIFMKIYAYETRGQTFGNPHGRKELSSKNFDEEYIRHIHSMINAYRSDTLGGRIVIETNALIDTKYRTWKRNADLINSLLALPKGMDEAGR